MNAQGVRAERHSVRAQIMPETPRRPNSNSNRARIQSNGSSVTRRGTTTKTTNRNDTKSRKLLRKM